MEKREIIKKRGIKKTCFFIFFLLVLISINSFITQAGVKTAEGGIGSPGGNYEWEDTIQMDEYLSAGSIIPINRYVGYQGKIICYL